ncbi:ankyrin repeat domain-containing protein [Nonomuraea solani]|uniref:ankyrin repeat domain-containing protein n=1 Tax=Nonomuraea solani TaxID=1144553 RepID=UPI0011B011C8|nr:ankyrin repeat domain-containing protein [Nonomuraea solani]
MPIRLANGKGDSLLMPAAYYGHAETVRKLVTSGADYGGAQGRARTPFAGALFAAESAMVRALRAGGADPAAGQPLVFATGRLFANGQFIQWFSQRDS